MYDDKLMNEFYEPANFGVIKGATGVGKVTSNIGNEIIKIFLLVEGKKIVDAEFQTFGGVVAIAASSAVTKIINGKTLDVARQISSTAILEIIGKVPENKKYILNLVVQAVKLAVDDCLQK